MQTLDMCIYIYLYVLFFCRILRDLKIKFLIKKKTGSLGSEANDPVFFHMYKSERTRPPFIMSTCSHKNYPVRHVQWCIGFYQEALCDLVQHLRRSYIIYMSNLMPLARPNCCKKMDVFGQKQVWSRCSRTRVNLFFPLILTISMPLPVFSKVFPTGVLELDHGQVSRVHIWPPAIPSSFLSLVLRSVAWPVDALYKTESNNLAFSLQFL